MRWIIPTRRGFFRGAGLMAAALSALPGGRRLRGAMAVRNAEEAMKVYTRLGLRPIINASGTYILTLILAGR